MKIWITRDSAFSLQCGGLERVWVWFRKPEYYAVYLTDKDRDTPFGDITVDQGLYRKYGWRSDESFGISCLSFGKWLGYTDGEHKELASHVWAELENHFGAPFEKWHEAESAGNARPENFLLELEIKITKI